MAEQHRKMEANKRAQKEEEKQFLQWSSASEARHEQIEKLRRTNAKHLALLQKLQAEEKKRRDGLMSDSFRNKVDESYFLQFGTSHR